MVSLAWWAAFPEAALGQAVQAALDWDAPGCIEPDALRAGVEAQLGRTVFGETPEVVLSVRLRRDAPGPTQRGSIEIALTLASRSGALFGRRTLRSETPDCRTLDDELVVVVSLLVDLPEEEIRLLVPAEAPREAPPAPIVAGRAGASFALSLGVLGSLDVQPGLTGTIVVAAEVSLLPELSLELGASFTPPVRAAVEDIGATFLSWTLRPGVCGQARVDVVRLGGCARIGVGMLSVQSDGLEPNRAVLRPWLELLVGPRVGVRWDALEVRLTAGVLVPLLRDSFFFGTPAVLLHRAAPVAPFVEVTLAYDFGS